MSTIKTNTLESVDGTFSIGVKELKPVPYLSNRNLLINGGFDVWQRGNDFVDVSTDTIQQTDGIATWYGATVRIYPLQLLQWKISQIVAMRKMDYLLITYRVQR